MNFQFATEDSFDGAGSADRERKPEQIRTPLGYLKMQSEILKKKNYFLKIPSILLFLFLSDHSVRA